MRLKVTATTQNQELFPSEPEWCCEVNLETGEIKPCASDPKTVLKTPRTAFLRAPQNVNLPHACIYLEHNLPADQRVAVYRASQWTESGSLVNQEDWQIVDPDQVLRFERNQAGKIQFPSGLTLEVGWQKK